MKIVRAFLAVAELAKKDGLSNLNQLPDCWERKIGEEWWIALNAHDTPKLAKSVDGCSAAEGFLVPPFSVYAERNGFPAGYFNASGGVFMRSTEDEFIAAVEREVVP